MPINNDQAKAQASRRKNLVDAILQLEAQADQLLLMGRPVLASQVQRKAERIRRRVKFEYPE